MELDTILFPPFCLSVLTIEYCLLMMVFSYFSRRSVINRKTLLLLQELKDWTRIKHIIQKRQGVNKNILLYTRNHLSGINGICLFFDHFILSLWNFSWKRRKLDFDIWMVLFLPDNQSALSWEPLMLITLIGMKNIFNLTFF